MRILNFRPEASPGSGKILARFDVCVTDEIRLNHVALRRNDAGILQAMPPNLRGSNVVHLAPRLQSAIAAAAIAELETNGGLQPDDRTRNG